MDNVKEEEKSSLNFKNICTVLQQVVKRTQKHQSLRFTLGVTRVKIFTYRNTNKNCFVVKLTVYEMAVTEYALMEECLSFPAVNG